MQCKREQQFQSEKKTKKKNQNLKNAFHYWGTLCYTIVRAHTTHRKRKCQRVRAAKHSGTLASKICSAPASRDECHASCTPWPAAPAFRVQVRRRCVCVCVWPGYAIHIYLYTHKHRTCTHKCSTFESTQSAQWDASQGEKQDFWASETRNTFLFNSSDFSKCFSATRGYSSYFGCLFPLSQGSATCCSCSLVVCGAHLRPCGTYQLCMSLTCRSIVCCVSSTTVHPGKVQRNLCGCKKTKEEKLRLATELEGIQRNTIGQKVERRL